MIHLDANFLIGAANRNSAVENQLASWLQQGESFSASSIAWAEFLNGPVKPPQVVAVEEVIQSRVIPFGKPEALMSAQLFNATGRKRGSRPDCFIAATAICSRALLATYNRKDFALFVALGLRLA